MHLTVSGNEWPNTTNVINDALAYYYILWFKTHIVCVCVCYTAVCATSSQQQVCASFSLQLFFPTTWHEYKNSCECTVVSQNCTPPGEYCSLSPADLCMCFFHINQGKKEMNLTLTGELPPYSFSTFMWLSSTRTSPAWFSWAGVPLFHPCNTQFSHPLSLLCKTHISIEKSHQEVNSQT